MLFCQHILRWGRLSYAGGVIIILCYSTFVLLTFEFPPSGLLWCDNDPCPVFTYCDCGKSFYCNCGQIGQSFYCNTVDPQP